MLMRKCRWLHMALLALCFTLPAHSWALGLGEIEVESALNERLSGTIELLDSKGLQVNEVVVSMASREDFERVGVERFFYLTNIKFEVESGSGGNAIVRVSSTQPIAEPYLNFIVEVLWPNGKLLKEFTVLLDPPTFSQAAAPAVAAPSQPVAQAPAAQTSPAQPATRRSGTGVNLRPAPGAASRQPVSGELMTTREDTMWKIASRTLPSQRVTVNQQMLAIQRKNPDAFINNNINLLKAGYVLDIPTESEALSIDSTVADSDVRAQAEDWRSGTSREQVANADSATQLIDDTAGSSEAASRSQLDASAPKQTQTPAAGANQGQVRILANTGEVASGTASGDDPSVNQLIEEKETLARQVDELTYQIDREKDIAVNQITVKDRQLEVKDAEIAQMQQQMKELREQMAAVAQNQDQSPQAPPEQTPWWMSPMVLFGMIGVLILVLVFALIALRKSRNEQEEIYASLEQNVADGEETPAVLEAEADYSEEFADEVEHETDAAIEPFIGALNDEADDEDATRPSADEVLAIDEDDAVDADALDAEADTEVAAQQASTTQAGDSAGQTGDVIGEAEIYIAYGRFGQAANLLSGVLGNEPERWDVRLKLLEVYVESHDEEQFASHAQYIVDNCDDDDVLLACRELEAQLGSNHVDLGADATSAVSEMNVNEAAAADVAADDDGFALELDDLEVPATDNGVTDEFQDLSLVEDTDFEETALEESGIEEPSTPDGNVAEFDLTELEVETEAEEGIEFELEFDGELEELDPAPELEAVAAEEAEATSEELGGDLGIDFDPERDVASDSAVEAEEAPEASAEVELDAEIAGDSVLDDTLSFDGEDDDGSVKQAMVEDEVDDFEFDSDGDSDINTTKLDLAEAYVDMGDADGAQDILNEVVEEGTPEQQQKAQEMLDRLAS